MALGVSRNQGTKVRDEPVSWEIMRCFVNATSMVTWPTTRFGQLGAKAYGGPRVLKSDEPRIETGADSARWSRAGEAENRAIGEV
jgi:hypothetical protein